MNPVIRRIFFLLVATIALSSCGATERDAVRLHDRAISSDGLAELAVSVSGGSPDGELPVMLPTAQLLDAANLFLSASIQAEYLETEGIEMSESDAELAKIEIERLIAEQSIGAVSRQSEAWDALTMIVWTSQQELPADVEVDIDYVRNTLRDTEVESRLGRWDKASLQIVPWGAAIPDITQPG